jgi:hypothetical protein
MPPPVQLAGLQVYRAYQTGLLAGPFLPAMFPWLHHLQPLPLPGVPQRTLALRPGFQVSAGHCFGKPVWNNAMQCMYGDW